MVDNQELPKCKGFLLKSMEDKSKTDNIKHSSSTLMFLIFFFGFSDLNLMMMMMMMMMNDNE